MKVCTLEFKGTVLRMCNDWKDLRGCIIEKRLPNIRYLVAQEALDDCRKKFFTVLPASHSAMGRPRDDHVDRSMETIFQIMEDSDDSQFLFEEFVEALTYEMYYVPHTKTIKERLVEKYGDDVITSINKHNQSIVCFHHTRQKLLTIKSLLHYVYNI